DLPVESFLENLRTQGGCSKLTLNAYTNDTQQFAGFLHSLNDRPPLVADFNPNQIKQFFDNERLQGRKHSTLLRRRASIRRFALYLNQHQLIDEGQNIGSELTNDSNSKRSWRKQHPKRLSSNDIDKVLEVISGANSSRALRDHAILSLLAKCGITIATLVSIDFEDFDGVNHKILTKPEGDSSGYWQNIPLTSPLISEYLREGRPNLTDSKVETALFVSQMGGRISRQAVWQSLKNWANVAKIKNPFTPRAIRYAAVSRMLERGLSVKQIQARIGHKNIFSTYALIRRITK
ncbi:MAG: tyrosine-type recombinase/integrase, partial [Chloroflexota bacterium]